MDNFSLYLHIPFCIQRCGYCDFNSTSGRMADIPAYVEALCQEACFLGQASPSILPVHTIFFGGGTPSLLPVQSIDKILITLRQYYNLLPGCEISLEANPRTVSREYLRCLFSAGFNRLSMGMQSAHFEDLKTLQRLHHHEDLVNSVHWARQAGFNNINLDLIYGIPNQTLEGWKFSINEAVKLQPEHLSLYALTLEPGTPLHTSVSSGLIPEPDDDLAADMYEVAEDILEKYNYTHYEISNWAQNCGNGKYFACRHNLQYWLNKPYLGLGAGAHSCAGGFRVANEPDLDTYIQIFSSHNAKVDFPFSPANCEKTLIDRYTEMQETMMVGLRLTEQGISNPVFFARYGCNLQAVFGEKIDLLINKNLLEWTGNESDVLRLTKRGRLLGNQVFIQFVGED